MDSIKLNKMAYQKFRAGQESDQPVNPAQPVRIVRVFRIRVGFYPTGAKRVVGITFSPWDLLEFK